MSADSPEQFSPASIAREMAAWPGRILAWVRREPGSALLAAALFVTVIYYFGFYRVFSNGLESTSEWAAKAWNPENDLEHGWVIFPAALVIAWWHRKELAAAPKSTSWAGLGLALLGAVTFVFAVRTIQARVAILALPLLIYGSVRFLWGRETARIILFPCAFLLFMVPLGFLVSRTVGLQNLSASVAANLGNLLGAKVLADGAKLKALDLAFEYEVSGGCSGIRSLTAMMMLAALWVHFTERELWKKVLIFCSSLLFALLGNFMRIFSVILFARYISPTVAGTIYHDWSGFIFFPFAVGAMIFFSNLLHRDWGATLKEALKEDEISAAAPARAATPSAPQSSGEAKPKGPISYDY
jgi:exosortase